MSRNDKLIANLAAARKLAEDAVDELRIEDELADGFRSRNGDLTLQDAITALNTLIAALPTPSVAGQPEREALAGFLSRLLWDRGNRVADWPEDEAEAYREFGWAEGIAAARKIMFENVADALSAAGYQREPEPRTVTTVEWGVTSSRGFITSPCKEDAMRLAKEWAEMVMTRTITISEWTPVTPSTEETP